MTHEKATPQNKVPSCLPVKAAYGDERIRAQG